ncbi:MAG: hypothetical protein DWC02_07035 [Candidatus Poseidoniales archaeon]|nr:MAG: hypothetical protein DWC02_07035 [Candidatus Poseidoniales archaeon]
MRSTRPLILCAILLLSSIPISPVGADSVEVCCESGEVDLFLRGPANSGSMTPFNIDFESQEAVITDAVQQQTEIAKWSISPAWSGNYPSSTWEFGIDYEIASAGGAQINASVKVKLGGETYTGTTDQTNSFLTGEGTLSINIDVEAGTVSSSSEVGVTFEAQTIFFSVPGPDAGLTFRWGGESDDSSINADLPLVDLVIDEPVTEGMDVYVSVIVASPFGQMTSAHANSLEASVNGIELGGDPIQTSSGDYVRLTWTWTSEIEGQQNITIGASIQLQSGTPTLSGSTGFEIFTVDDGTGGGGVFYPNEEPLVTDGKGSPLIAKMSLNLSTNEEYLTLERVIQLTIDDEVAYWMRWGMDNIGSEEPLSQPLKIFQSDLVKEEDRRNRIIDDIEKSEFENLMPTLAVTYMNDGMFLELEEMIRSDVDELEKISFDVDLMGENKVDKHPLMLTITTLQILDSNEVTTLLRNFVRVQPTPVWSSVDLSVDIRTSLMSSFTSPTITGDDSLELTQRRTPLGETIQIRAPELSPSATFTFSAMPTSNPLNAPLTLSITTLAILLGGLWFALKMTRTKRRSALWIEMVLVPANLMALYLAYSPFTVGAIAAITVTIWILTAIASPRRKNSGGVKPPKNDYPIIECPACSTPNPITSEQRPFRLPCSGCGRVLKIVE